MKTLIAIVGGFASGIFLRSLFVIGWWEFIVFLIPAAFFAIAAYRKKRIAYTLAALFFCFLSLGALRATVSDHKIPHIFADRIGDRVQYRGIVVSDPDQREKNQRIAVQVRSGDDTTTMLSVVPLTVHTAVGDTVLVSGTLERPEPFADDNGRIFRYDKYLEKDGVYCLLSFGTLRVIESAPWYSVPAALARIKHGLLDGLSRTLPNPYAALAGGLIIGGKSGLGADLKEAFIRSGLIQIVVLSGYNVMVVAEWIMAVLSYAKLSRRLAAGAGAFAILIFIGIAGGGATAVRAAIMACIALYARATGKTYAAGRALLAAIFLMLLWNPLYLVFDPGFGLSVVATAGLIWIAPIIEMKLSFLKRPIWKNTIATTLAAQIAVLPLLLYDTGNLSIVAIPANLLVTPVIPLAMGMSAVAGFAGILFGHFAPLVGTLLSFPAYVLNAYVIWIAEKSSALPFAVFTIPPFPFWVTLLLYAFLIIYFASSKRFSGTLQLMFARKASM